MTCAAVTTPPGNRVPDETLSRVRRLCALLKKAHPDARCALDHSDPLELLVATILSAQCTDKRVNMVTPALFKRCRSAADYANIPQAEIENLIRSTGFYKNKATNIRAAGAALLKNHGGKVPASMEALVALPGVGRKTANVVLGNAFGVNEGIVVDTHVARLSQRLGLSAHKDPVRIEADLMRLIPRQDWTLFSHWLILHGRSRCSARKPDCAGCELNALCPSAQMQAPSGRSRAMRLPKSPPQPRSKPRSNTPGRQRQKPASIASP